MVALHPYIAELLPQPKRATPVPDIDLGQEKRMEITNQREGAPAHFPTRHPPHS
jgi:hypothetical protein